MKQFLLILMVLFGICSTLFAQEDSVVFSKDMQFNEGIYLSYADFRRNDPIGKIHIDMPGDKTQLDFIGKTISENKTINIHREGQTEKYQTDKFFGYMQNNTLYLNYNGKFYRVLMFGNISPFIASIEYTTYSSNWGPGYYYGPGMMGPGMSVPVKQKELRQYYFDFYTSEIYDVNMENTLRILSRDTELYNEFMALKKRQRKDMMNIYIRKYNDRHPPKFPK